MLDEFKEFLRGPEGLKITRGFEGCREITITWDEEASNAMDIHQRWTTNAFFKDKHNFREETRRVEHFAAEALIKMKKLSRQKKHKMETVSSYGIFPAANQNIVVLPDVKSKAEKM